MAERGIPRSEMILSVSFMYPLGTLSGDTPEPNQMGANRSNILFSVAKALVSLQVEYLDLLQCKETSILQPSSTQ